MAPCNSKVMPNTHTPTVSSWRVLAGSSYTNIDYISLLFGIYWFWGVVGMFPVFVFFCFMFYWKENLVACFSAQSHTWKKKELQLEHSLNCLLNEDRVSFLALSLQTWGESFRVFLSELQTAPLIACSHLYSILKLPVSLLPRNSGKLAASGHCSSPVALSSSEQITDSFLSHIFLCLFRMFRSIFLKTFAI